jgi:hypothetical protein
MISAFRGAPSLYKQHHAQLLHLPSALSPSFHFFRVSEKDVQTKRLYPVLVMLSESPVRDFRSHSRYRCTVPVREGGELELGASFFTMTLYSTCQASH